MIVRVRAINTVCPGDASAQLALSEGADSTWESQKPKCRDFYRCDLMRSRRKTIDGPVPWRCSDDRA